MNFQEIFELFGFGVWIIVYFIEFFFVFRNCLFRAFSDQLSGSHRNHLEYRRDVVQYMKDFRADFEPFVEDDVPFDKYGIYIFSFPSEKLQMNLF